MEKLKQIIQKLDGVDPYHLLQTKPTDDFTTLKKNYRLLALKYHPDRNKQQTAKEKFIQINLAYQFLQQEDNRQIYQYHLKALEEQKIRESQMSENRKKMLDELKRREQEFNQRKKDLDSELKRKKEFFQKKMREEEERQKLKQQILSEIKPSKYYEQLMSIKIEWQQGLSFSNFLLQKAFSKYGVITNIKLESKSRQAIVSFSSIQVCTQTVKKFKNPQIKVDYLVDKERRQYLMRALKKQQNKEVDFSLTSQNLSRLKQILNRNSSVYQQHQHMQL